MVKKSTDNKIDYRTKFGRKVKFYAEAAARGGKHGLWGLRKLGELFKAEKLNKSNL